MGRSTRQAAGTRDALAAWIARDPAFHGVGKRLAGRLAEHFGERLHHALAQRDSGVAEIVGDELAETIFAAFELRADEAALLAWMEERGLVRAVGAAVAIRIARCWGAAGRSALEANPYLLVAFLPWAVVDRVGQALGVPADDPRRAAAAVEATLYARLDGNDTLMPEAALRAGAARLLGDAAPAIDPVAAAIAEGGACRLGDGVQPFGAATMEGVVAEWVADAVARPAYGDLLLGPSDMGALDAAVEACAAAMPHAPTDAQHAAMRLAQERRLMVVAGYAGSGKTAALRGVCDVAAGFGRDLHLIALSGRASQRMAEATGRPAGTIAGFLRRLADNGPPAPGALVIVDEASMVDLPTMWRLVRGLGDASLVMVGDPAQLPPIGFGLTFHALCEAEGVPRVILDRVLRQTAASGIPTVAEAVRHGRTPVLPTFEGAMPGVSFVPCPPKRAIATIAEIGRRLRDDGVLLGETQIVAPTRAGLAGIEAINRFFHRARRMGGHANPLPGHDGVVAGDPILWNRNDWERGLMNGAMGRLHSVIGGIGHATLDGAPVELTAADADRIELAYAISVHKAQGSQWTRVVVPVFSSRLLDRALLYTALTRATEQVILVGDPVAFGAAVTNPPRSLCRSVGLGERLRLTMAS